MYECSDGYDEHFCKNVSCVDDCDCSSYYSFTCNRQQKYFTTSMKNLLGNFKTIFLSNAYFFSENITVNNNTFTFQPIYLEIKNSHLQNERSFDYLKLLNNLKILIIQNTKIKNIQIFPINLQNLRLNNCSLKKLKKNEFGGNFQLKYLNLSYNSIMEIEENAFQDLENLKILNLNFNNLKYISSKIINHLKFIEILNLQTVSFKNHFHELKKINFNQFQFIQNIFFEYNFFCCFFDQYRKKEDNKISNICYWSKSVKISCKSIFNDKLSVTITICLLAYQFITFIAFFYIKYIQKRHTKEVVKIFTFKNVLNIFSDFIQFAYFIVLLIIYFTVEMFYLFTIDWISSLYCKFIFISLIFLIVFFKFHDLTEYLLIFMRIQMHSKFIPKRIIYYSIPINFSLFSILSFCLAFEFNSIFIFNPFCHPLSVVKRSFIISFLVYIFALSIISFSLQIYCLKSSFKTRKNEIFRTTFEIFYLFILIFMIIKKPDKIENNLGLFILFFHFLLLRIPYDIHLKKYFEIQKKKKEKEK